MLTRNEFLTIAIQDKTAIKKLCREITLEMGHAGAFNYFLELRRDIQQALAKYSEKKTDLDGIQLNAIKIVRWLEIWCAEWFRLETKKEIIKRNPLMPQKNIKDVAENEWERYLREHSY